MLSIAGGLCIYVAFSQLSGLLTINDYVPFALKQLEVLLIKIWLPWVLLSPLVLWISRTYPIEPENWLKQIFLHLGIFLILSLAHIAVLSYHYHFFELMAEGMERYQPWQHIGHFLFGDSFFLFNLIIYTVFIASFNLRNFYTLAQKKALETAQLNDQLSKAKLQALKMQINPHFLFNTLNVIQVLVMKKDITKATETLSLLSDFLRQTLDDSGEQWIPLKEELALIEQYLSIEQVRFGDRLAIHKNYSEDVMAISVPPMILQPLVENAVKHGLGEKQHKGTLTIQTQKVADKLVITLTDDGAGCDAEQAINDKQRIGLSNVIQRLQHLYDKQHLFDFKSVLGRGTTIKIELPLTLSKALND